MVASLSDCALCQGTHCLPVQPHSLGVAVGVRFGLLMLLGSFEVAGIDFDCSLDCIWGVILYHIRF